MLCFWSRDRSEHWGESCVFLSTICQQFVNTMLCFGTFHFSTIMSSIAKNDFSFQLDKKIVSKIEKNFRISTNSPAKKRNDFHFLGCYFTKMHGITTAQGIWTSLLSAFLISFLSRLLF